LKEFAEIMFALSISEAEDEQTFSMRQHTVGDRRGRSKDELVTPSVLFTIRDESGMACPELRVRQFGSRIKSPARVSHLMQLATTRSRTGRCAASCRNILNQVAHPHPIESNRHASSAIVHIIAGLEVQDQSE
jgi:hypothetical protein